MDRRARYAKTGAGVTGSCNWVSSVAMLIAMLKVVDVKTWRGRGGTVRECEFDFWWITTDFRFEILGVEPRPSHHSEY